MLFESVILLPPKFGYLRYYEVMTRSISYLVTPLMSYCQHITVFRFIWASRFSKSLSTIRGIAGLLLYCCV